MTRKYNIIGIGNAIIDINCQVEGNFLIEHNLTKGGMFLIGEEDASKLSHLKYQKISSGGSVANSIATLAMLDSKTAFIGKVANDKFGDIFSSDLKKDGVDFICKNKEKSGKTAKSFVFITPDGERTMCTYLGSSSRIENEIDENIIKDCHILYLEGYLWDEPETIVALRQSIEIAKNNNTKVAFSLSDAFCVERHKMGFLNAMEQFDILFGNELEISILIGNDFAKDNYKKVQETINHFGPDAIIVMTMGENGAIIFEGIKNIYHIPTTKSNKVIDQTGAGDAFAAGFLYAFSNGFDLKDCGRLGNILANEVIKQIGARLEKDKIIELIL